jgi:hypothetical protein
MRNHELTNLNGRTDTKIFSLLMLAELSVPIGRQLNEFKRIKSRRFRSIYRFEHIDTNSSGKVVIN